MKNVKVGDTHNFALVGHSGDGKTSVGEALLHAAGATEALGSVTAGTSSLGNFDDLPSDASFGWLGPLAPTMVAAGQWVLPVFRPDRGVDVWSSDGSLAGTARVATLAEEAHAIVHPVRSMWTPGRRSCAAPRKTTC